MRSNPGVAIQKTSSKVCGVGNSALLSIPLVKQDATIMADKYEAYIQAFDKALQSGQHLKGKDGVLTPRIKQITKGGSGR